MALEAAISLESFSDNVRKTNEMPSRVSVVDVIAKTKGVTKNYAAQLFRRLQEAGNAPSCTEVACATLSYFSIAGRPPR